MAKPFIAYDGYKSEVLVETGEATVTELKETGSTVQVVFQHTNPKVKQPFGGWLKKEDPLVDYAKLAHQEGRAVSYRIEIQRKSGEPKDIPIRELRGENDMQKAHKHTLKVLAAIDGTLSMEAVTNPEFDESGDRKRATAETFQGADTGGGSGAGVSVNLDTVRNLLPYLTDDSALTLAGLSGEDENTLKAFSQNVKQSPAHLSQIVFEVVKAVSTELNSENVQTVSEGVLYIADSVQVEAFGLSHATRFSASHAQVRELVLAHLRLNPEAVQAVENKDMEGMTQLAQAVLDAYKAVSAIMVKDAPTRYLSLSGGKARGQARRQQPRQEQARRQQPPQTQAQPTREQPAQEEQKQDEKTAEIPKDIFILSFSDDELAEMEKAGLAEKQTIKHFADSIASEIPKDEYTALSDFIEYVFGQGKRKAQQVPDEALRSLVDAYAVAGPKEFRKAVLYVSKNLH